MLRRVLPVLLLLAPGLAIARQKPKAAAPRPAVVRVTDAECAKVAQHMLDLEVDELRRTDADFRALSSTEQMAAVEQMRNDPEMQQLARGCGSQLTRADADCILGAKTKAKSEACVEALPGEEERAPPAETPPPSRPAKPRKK
jgi:hypothetical protein